MATYHVATDGNNANDGLSRVNAWRTAAKAVATAASGSEILFYYDPAVSAEFTEGAELTINNSLVFVGVDSSGVRADDWLTNGANTTWNKDEQPTIIWTGSYALRCIEPQTGDRITLYGMTIHGSGTASNCVTNTATDGNIKAYDCTFRDPSNTAAADYPVGMTQAGDELHRCLLIGGEHNLNIGSSCSASFCILSGAYDQPVLVNAGTVTAYLNNCLILYGNEDGGVVNDPIAAGGSGQTILNCISYNNAISYGWDLNRNTGADYTNAWTTNSASFHTTAPYNGTPGANHISSDPQFLDAAAGDFRLSDSSELLTAGTTTNVLGNLTYDLQALTTNYPIGPYIGAPAVSAWTFTEGSNKSGSILSDFTLNTLPAHKSDYNRTLDAIPFGLTTPGPISLKKRNAPYKLTR